MKKTVYILAVMLVFASACNKNESDTLNGSWKLVGVYDKTTGIHLQPPPGGTEDVVITFTPGNSFHGHTLVNIFSGGSYSIPSANKIVFEDFISTLVAEDEWGSGFLTVLQACMLQSVRPCTPSTYSVAADTLKIFSPLTYDIVLQKQ